MDESKGDVSLKELIYKINQIYRYLLSKWVWLLIVGIIGGAMGYIYALNTRKKYAADLSFVLSGDSKGAGGLMGLVSQFGVDISGGGEDVFSGDNIITLMTSRRMVQQALFKKINETNTSLINTITIEFKLNEKWSKSDRLKHAFPFPDSPDKMLPVQDSLAREMYTMVSKKILNVAKPDKKQSIFKVTTISTNELFSIYLTKFLVDETAKFYIATKTKVAKQNLDMLQREADSLRHLLGNTITTTAEALDQNFNLNPAYQVKRSRVQEGQTNATVLGTAYGEVVKNLEIAKITLQKETPLFQVVDEPTLPLKQIRTGKLTFAMIGAIALVFLTIVFLLGRRLYIDVMNEK